MKFALVSLQKFLNIRKINYLKKLLNYKAFMFLQIT